MSAADTLILTRGDVERLVGMDDAIDVVEAAFRSHGEGRASNVTRNFAVGARVMSIKAGALTPLGRVGLKTLGLVVLCESTQLRRPLAIMEQAPITYLRTGAAGAVAAKHLARADCRSVGILGTGRQGRAQLEGLAKIFHLDRVRAWSPTPRHRSAYAHDMSAALGIAVEAVDEPKAAVDGQDVVVTATPAQAPVIARSWIAAGTHVNAMGADMPGSQELPADLLKDADVFADDVEQALWMGAVNVPITTGTLSRDDLRGSLGAVIAGRSPGRRSATSITVFDCSGLGMLDVALAQRVYERADRDSGLRRVDWFS